MTKITKIILVFLLITNISCQKYPEISGNFNRKIKIDNYKRSYKLHLPKDFNKNKDNLFPLVVVLHGGGGNSRQIKKETDFNEMSDKENFIVVYPEALNRKWADGRETTESSVEGIDDVNFIKTLIDTLENHYNIDENRIYVTGISNGGFMTITLLCALPDVFAAGASVTAMLPVKLEDSVPSNKNSLLMIAGDEDPLVPFEGGQMQKPSSGGLILSAFETCKLWAVNNSCDTTPTIEQLPDLKDDGTTVSLYTYPNGTKSVQMYVVNNGGHTWPGGSQYLPKKVIGKLSKDIDATECIWEFFKNNEK